MSDHECKLVFADLIYIGRLGLFSDSSYCSLHELKWDLVLFKECHRALKLNDEVHNLQESDADVLINGLIEEYWVLQPHLEIEVNTVLDNLFTLCEAVHYDFAEFAESLAVFAPANDRQVWIEFVVKKLFEAQ